MKHKFIKVAVLSGIAVLTVVYSCSDKPHAEVPEVQNPKPLIPSEGIQVIDGTLHFDSAAVYIATTEKLGAMTQSEREAWEKSIGFTSLQTDIEHVYSALAATADDDEAGYNRILADNSDIVELQDDEVSPIIQSVSYATVCNRKGVFYIGNVIHKVDGGLIAMAEGATEASVTDALQKNVKGLKSFNGEDDITIVNYGATSKIAPLSSYCGTEKTAWAEHDKRRIMLKIRVYTKTCKETCCQYFHSYHWEYTVRNEKKVLGRWKPNDSSGKVEDIAFTVSAPFGTSAGFNYVTQIQDFVYRDVTLSWSLVSSGGCNTGFSRTDIIGQTVETRSPVTYNPLDSPEFSRVKGSATNLQLDNRYWAEIKCGAW